MNAADTGRASYDFERLRATQLYAPGRRVDAAYRSGRWAEPIDRLLGAGYSFASCSFDAHGYLFRGMQRGLRAALAAGVFSHFDGDDELCGVERVMNVSFLSHEASDAVTVSRMHATPADAGLLVIRAAVFERARAAGEAAVLAVGDGGIVFRYPFLARPLRLDEVSVVFVHESAGPVLSNSERPRMLTLAGDDRAGLEHDLLAQCARQALEAARPGPDADHPRR